MSDLLTATREELIALVYELSDKIHAQEAQIAYLKEQLHQKGQIDTSSKTSSFVKPNVKRKKTKEKKKRVYSYHRAKEKATEQVFHGLSVCPDCGEKLIGKPSVAYTKQVINLPQVPYTVTEHIVCKYWCLSCKRRVMPFVDFSKTLLGKGMIGINLAASIATLRERLRLPLPVIKTYLKVFYQLNLSLGEITEILHTVARIGKPQYDNLLEGIRKSPTIYADETGGREDGRNGYFWSFSTDNTHCLLYRKSRGKTVVEEIVGRDSEKFEGVLTTDFYAAYNTYRGFHQRCWVHLLRDIHGLREQYKKHPPLNIWAKKVKRIYEEAKAYAGPAPNLPVGLAIEELIVKQQEFEKKLRDVSLPYINTDVPMSTICARALTFMLELFVFIRFPNVSSDNNHAERILRHTVVARKIQGGTRSAKGSETKTILTSLFDTWKLRGLNPLTQCRLLIATTPCQ